MTRKITARIALFAFLPLALAACSSQPGAAPTEEPPLKGASIGGPFELVDKDGKTVRWADFKGKYRIVYFGYAFCPDVCPTDMQRSMAALKAFEKKSPALGARVQPIFVTIDPKRDTPEVVGEFAANFHPRLIGLTGSEEQVKSAADTFRVFYQKGKDSGNGGYLMDHTNITYLFGPNGEPLATLPTDLQPAAIEAELEKWVH